MSLRNFSGWLGAVAFMGVLYAFQMPFREYPGMEYNNFPKPADWEEKTEWAFARLMYARAAGYGRGFGRGYGRYGSGDGLGGYARGALDYPRADGHFSLVILRV